MKIATRVEWSIWLKFGVEWSGVLKIWSTTRVFGQYSGVVAGVSVAVKSLSLENFQKMARNSKKKQFYYKDFGVSLYVKAL